MHIAFIYRALYKVLYRASIYRVFNIEYCAKRYIERCSILVLYINRTLKI